MLKTTKTSRVTQTFISSDEMGIVGLEDLSPGWLVGALGWITGFPVFTDILESSVVRLEILEVETRAGEAILILVGAGRLGLPTVDDFRTGLELGFCSVTKPLKEIFLNKIYNQNSKIYEINLVA